jgi:hypothetical protein
VQVFSRRARIAAVLTALLTLAFAIITVVTLQRLQGMPMTVTTVDMDLRSEKALTVRSSQQFSNRNAWGAGYWWLISVAADAGVSGPAPPASLLTMRPADASVRGAQRGGAGRTVSMRTDASDAHR